MDRLDESAVKSILSAGRHMGRDRYQEGRLVLVGKHIKKWRGHFYVYQKQADGSEIRRHRNIPLGLKSELDRGEAKAKLREIIVRETKDVVPAPVNVTLRWFYENRFLPQKEQQWKVTSRPKTKCFIENYLLKRFGDTLLGDLDKFTLQTYLTRWRRDTQRAFCPKSACTSIPCSMKRSNWRCCRRIPLASLRYRSAESAGQRSTSRLKRFPKFCST